MLHAGYKDTVNMNPTRDLPEGYLPGIHAMRTPLQTEPFRGVIQIRSCGGKIPG